MPTTVNSQIDVSILKNQMGIEIVDDGNGHLNAGDVLINRSASTVETHEISAEEIRTPAQLSALLNQYTHGRSMISFVYDSQRAKAFIASASPQNETYVRLYEVTATDDNRIIADGSSIPHLTPRRTSDPLAGAHSLSVARDRADYGLSSSIGFVTTPAYDLATTPCDSKPTEPEKLACYKERDEAAIRAETLRDLQQKSAAAKSKIRTAILNNTLTSELITEFTRLQEQISAL